MINKPTQTRFLDLVNSMRKHQRAELNENNMNIIEDLYTDPFPGDFVLSSMLDDQTTLLIGRKGTGKSTIINRFQHEIRKSVDKLSLYIDVKSIYIQAKDSTPNLEDNLYSILSHKEKEIYFIYVEFLKKVIEELKIEINTAVFKHPVIKFFKGGITEKEFKARLTNIFEKKVKFEDISAIKEIKSKNEIEKGEKLTTNSSRKGGFSPVISGDKLSLGSLSGEFQEKKEKDTTELTSKEYSAILVRYFNIIELMNEIKALLRKLGVKTLYICLDDASELDKTALDTFVRTIVSPLNNSSDGFFRFKISFYPGRDSLPEIDRTKVETINLDYFKLYQATGVDKVEELAVDYTRRLLNKRFKYYFGEEINLDDFFDTSSHDMEYYYRLLFFTSSNVTRLLGKILWYSARQSIFAGKKITKSIIQDASKQLYLQELKLVLFNNEHIQYKDYNEAFEREHLKNLLTEIIGKAKENKRHIGASSSAIFSQYTPNTAPSNYLYFTTDYEHIISSLELNFFITKYTQQKGRGSGSGSSYIPGVEQSVYTLNYGLCQTEDIVCDEKSDRKFRIERVFDFNKLIDEWANTQKEIICTNCNSEHDLSMINAIEKLGMICVNCGQKACVIRTKTISLPKSVVQIPEKYYQVLNALRLENDQRVRDIALELDYNRWTVASLIRQDRLLQKDGYVEARLEGDSNIYNITSKGLKTFFSNI